MTGPIDDLEPKSHDADPRQCPKCRQTMDKRTHKGITVDHCPSCQGLWFDLRELEDLRKLAGSEALDPSEPHGSDDRVPASELRCPDHGQPLVRVADPKQPHVRMEKCSICYGVFLDAGEFRDLKVLTAQEYLESVFSNLRY